MAKSKKRKGKRVNAPFHLTAKSGKWWCGVMEKYILESHHQILLTLAAESWDRSETARKHLRKYGLVYKNRFGCPMPRPENSIEQKNKLAFARLLREIGLDLGSPGENRPPEVTRK